MQNKKLNSNILKLNSNKFLERAFNPCNTKKEYNREIVNKLNEFLLQYEYKRLGGGKSGATVYMLSNNCNKYIFKFSENAIITTTIIGDECKKNQKSINELKREKICNPEFKNCSKINTSKTSNIKIYNSGLSYIRAIREIYLMKKYSELQYKLKNKLSNTSSNTSSNILSNTSSNTSSNRSSNRLSLTNNVSDLYITPEIFALGFIHNHKVIETEVLESNEQDSCNIIITKNNQEKKTKILKVLQLSPINLNEQTNKYMPFIIQEKVEGKELLYYENYLVIYNKFKKIFKKLNITNNKINEIDKPITNIKQIENEQINKFKIMQNFIKNNIENSNTNLKKKMEEFLNMRLLTSSVILKILLSLGKVLLKFKELLSDKIGCHRDMHPGNIFIIEDNENNINVKLIDFDLSITNKNELSSNKKCTRNTMDSYSSIKNSFKKIFKKSGVTIKTTIDYLGLECYTSIFIGKTPDFLLEDDDMFQYLMYIKKFHYGMKNTNLKKSILNNLKSIIKKTQEMYPTASKFSFGKSETDNNKIKRLNDSKFYFLKEFIIFLQNIKKNNINIQ